MDDCKRHQYHRKRQLPVAGSSPVDRNTNTSHARGTCTRCTENAPTERITPLGSKVTITNVSNYYIPQAWISELSSPIAILEDVLGSIVVTAPGSNATNIINVYPEVSSIRDQGNIVKVFGVPNTQIEVVDVDLNLVIGNGALGAGEHETVVTTTTPFVVGRRYLVRDPGDLTPDYEMFAVECIRREGFSETFGSGSAMSPISYDSRLFPGGLYRTTVGISTSPAPADYVTYPGWLALAVDTPERTNQDVILPYPDPVSGPNSLINPDPSKRLFLFMPTGFVPPTTGEGQIYYQFDIVNDPALIGWVVLSQFALNVNEELKLSEIGGALVHSGPLTPPAAVATSGGGQSAATTSAPLSLSDLSEFNLVPPELETCPKPDERKLDKLIKEGMKDAARDK